MNSRRRRAPRCFIGRATAVKPVVYATNFYKDPGNGAYSAQVGEVIVTAPSFSQLRDAIRKEQQKQRGGK